MSSLAIKTDTFGATSSQAWIHDPAHVDKVGDSLDLALFAAVSDTIANGSVLSGIAVAEVTATGLFGPYNPAATNGTQAFAGYVYDDVPTRDATTGNLGFSRVVGGVVRTEKLPLASAAVGTAGRVDDAAITTYTGRTRLVHL